MDYVSLNAIFNFHTTLNSKDIVNFITFFTVYKGKVEKCPLLFLLSDDTHQVKAVLMEDQDPDVATWCLTWRLVRLLLSRCTAP